MNPIYLFKDSHQPSPFRTRGTSSINKHLTALGRPGYSLWIRLYVDTAWLKASLTRYQEALRTIASLNTRATRAERMLSKYEQDLETLQNTLNQTNSDMQEMVKMVELLYETNRTLRDTVDILLKDRTIEPGNDVPALSEATLDMVAQRVQANMASGPAAVDNQCNVDDTSDQHMQECLSSLD